MVVIQTLLVEIEGEVTKGSNTGPNIEVAKPPIFNGEASKVAGFIIIYKLYLRMKIREVLVEEQIQYCYIYRKGWWICGRRIC